MTKVVVITPVNRYLGFSAPISPIDQFTKAGQMLGRGVQVTFVDPQKSYVTINRNEIRLMDESGEPVEGDVYFAFGHDLLDRNMTKYIIRALEVSGKKVINSYHSLTILDDKALLAIELSKSNLPVAQSAIASARSNSQAILGFLGGSKVIAKTSGFSAGGVGVAPIPPSIDYLAPALWAARMDSKPKVLQNDLYQGTTGPRTVIRAYVVGGELVGCYTTKGYGIVNCAGLARESKAQAYNPTEDQAQILIDAAKLVRATGYCRIDAVGGDERFSIIEINPLARIDADHYGLNIPKAVLEHAIRLHKEST